MALEPAPCATCGGGGGASADVENNILCDTMPDGSIVGTALAVYVYDENGNPVGAPTFVDPVTGVEYIPQGMLMVCPGETGCLEPVQFCFTSTTTGPVEHQGRMFDAVMPLNPGFALESITVDGVTTPQNLVWDVSDSTGQAFADDLVAALTLLFPTANSITVVPPGSQDCGNPVGTFTIHVGCLRLDQDPPDTLRFTYNGGEDLVQNPAYNENPPLNPPVSQGNYGYHLLARQDDPGPFPGTPPSGRADCTNVANRGWETNDSGRTFEIWGQDVAGGVTATPRGTPIQEVNSDGGPVGGTTIWQTFQVTSAGNFTIRLVHGGRDPGETHTIKLSTGDTNFGGPGDLINNVTLNTPVVYSGGAWTTFSQVVALAPGLYTLSFQSNNPTGNTARGGLFTDMRAFVDVPGLFSDSIRTDNGCTVSTNETSSTTVCEYWSPICNSGVIESWKNAETNETLSNAAFWGQVPSPECCTGTTTGGGGTVTPGNLVHNYEVCGVVGGVPQTLNRVVYTNQSGGVVAGAFVGPDGGPVTPTSWTPGACAFPLVSRDTELVELCDTQPNGTVTTFVRRMTFDQNGTVVSAENIDQDGVLYNPTGAVTFCSNKGSVGEFILCDNFEFPPGTPLRISFIRKFFQDDAGLVTNVVDLTVNGDQYETQGLVGACEQTETSVGWESICYTLTSTGVTIHAGTKRHDDQFPPPGFLVFDSAGVQVNTAVDGYTQVPCVQIRDVEQQILCDATPTRFLRTYRYDSVTGAATVINTTLDGTTVFAPVGAVGVCATTVTTDLDFDQLILCDSNGTQFLRRYTFNSTTGAVTATTNLTLAGAGFAPVGAVALCADCCPVVIGTGCSNTGSLRYVALRNANGTISLLDAVSGAAITGANVVACASDDTAITQTSEAKLLAAGQTWTPGVDLVGTLTGLSFQVLTGTADLVDSNGTAANDLPAGTSVSWSVEDNNTLTAPQSITADAASTVFVNWTRK